jgi:hypothetical protein
LAVEASNVADLLPGILADNGLEHVVDIVPATVESLIHDGIDAFIQSYPRVRQLGGVHCLVSEWMGFYLVHECMLPSVIAARDFFTAVNERIGGVGAPSPRMIPDVATLLCCPVQLATLQSRYEASWAMKDHALNLRRVGTAEFEAKLLGLTSESPTRPLIEAIDPDALLADPEALCTIDLTRCTVDQSLALSGSVFFRHYRVPTAENCPSNLHTVAHGIAMWFDVGCRQSHNLDAEWILRLSTAPSAAPTHWKQSVILFPEEFRTGYGKINVEDLQCREVSGSAPEDLLGARVTLQCLDRARRLFNIEVELL